MQIPGVANFESKLSKFPPSRLREELDLVYGFLDIWVGGIGGLQSVALFCIWA